MAQRLVIVAASACGLAGGAAADEAAKAAMLLPGSINDQSWNAIGYSGLTAIKALGFDVIYTENTPDFDEATAMDDYAQHGCSIVLGHSGRFLSAAQRVGLDYPTVQFIVGTAAAGQSLDVASIDYDSAAFGCQLGVLPARMSKTGKVGGVYGLEGLPNITDIAHGALGWHRLGRPVAAGLLPTT